MIIKKAVHSLAAAAVALAVGTQATSADALGCQQDFTIPTPIGGRTCAANGASATGDAFDSSGGRGTTYTYKVKFNAGQSDAVGILLKGDGTQTREANGTACPAARDFPPIDSSFGKELKCNVVPTFSAVKLRVVVT